MLDLIRDLKYVVIIADGHFERKNVDDYSKAIAILPSAKVYKMRADCYDLMGHADLAAQDRASAAKF